MAIFKQGRVKKGSQFCLQNIITMEPKLIEEELFKQATVEITEWLSPIKSNDFAEYRDEDFLKVLGIDENLSVGLDEFWPKRGPQWDALAKAKNNKVVLVEAKANIPEMVSSPCKAGSESLSKIEDAFYELSKYLETEKSKYLWTGKFYQYINRIAHLYFLRVLNDIDAYLVFLCFYNDKTTNGPTSIEEWNGAIQTMEYFLGIRSHKLKKYMIDIFINCDEIKK